MRMRERGELRTCGSVLRSSDTTKWRRVVFLLRPLTSISFNKASSLKPLAAPRNEPPFKWLPTARTISRIFTRLRLDFSWSQACSKSSKSCCVCFMFHQTFSTKFQIKWKSKVCKSQVMVSITSRLWLDTVDYRVRCYNSDVVIDMNYELGRGYMESYSRRPKSQSWWRGRSWVPTTLLQPMVG